MTWSGQPLRPALGDLARLQQTAVFLDRRVDPGQPMDFTQRDATLEDLLSRLAEQLDLGLGATGEN